MDSDHQYDYEDYYQDGYEDYDDGDQSYEDDDGNNSDDESHHENDQEKQDEHVFSDIQDDDYLAEYEIQDNQEEEVQDGNNQEMEMGEHEDNMHDYQNEYQNSDNEQESFMFKSFMDSFTKVGLKLAPSSLTNLTTLQSLINKYTFSNDLFQFDKYKLNQENLAFQQESRINYEIDEMKITNASFGILLPGKQFGLYDQFICFQDQARQIIKNGIFRLRKEFRIGVVVQILAQHRFDLYTKKETKIQIKTSQITKIIYAEKQKMLFIQFQGAPAFYTNERQDDTRNLQKQKKNQHKAKHRLLSAYLIEQDAMNGTLNIKHSPKKWERLRNISLSQYQQNDIIMKHVGFRNKVLMISLENQDDEKELVKIVRSFQRQIKELSVRTGIRVCPIEQLRSKYSINNIQNKFIALEKKYRFEAFQIQFSLISQLFDCDFVTLSHIQEVSSYIITLVNNSKSLEEEEETVRRVRQILISLNRDQLYGKLKDGNTLLKIFKMKMNRKGKKKLNFADNIQIKALKATPSGLLPAGWTRDLRNRMVRHFHNNDFQFLKIQVTNDDDERGKLFNGGQAMRKHLYELLTNVKLLKVNYLPIGWTQSQLKTSSLWYTCESIEGLKVVPRQELVAFLGKFDHIKNAALKAARIGQNLSTGKSVDLEKIQIKQGDDQKIGKYLYTDGIGKISPDLVKKIRKQLQIPATAIQMRYLGYKGVLLINYKLPPNTIYFRDSMKKFECPHKDAKKYFDVLDYNYYKPGYLNRQILILLAANGIQSEGLKDLQRQYIRKILQQGLKFQEIIENDKGDFDLANGFKEKSYTQFDPMKKKLDNIADVLKELGSQKQIQIMGEPTLNGILIQKYYLMFERLVKKSHIRVDKSARILGVIDDYGILKQNQVYCTILKDESTEGLSRKGMKKKMKMLYQRSKQLKNKDRITAVKNLQQEMAQMNLNQGKKIIKKSALTKSDRKLLKQYAELQKNITRFNVSGKVMLTRNPCMHPADIRVVTCVSQEEASKRFQALHKSPNYFEKIPNCVIFPKAGKYPLTSQIGGSDLDGDTFFITWDERLVPQKSLPPFITDDEQKKQRIWQGNDFNHMIDFFCEFVFNNNLGRLANSHLVHADQQNNALYYKCLELCKIHNKAVDYPKKGYLFDFPKQFWVREYPHFMEKGKQKKSYKSTSVLGELYDEAMSYYNQFVQKSKKIKYNLAPMKTCMGINFSEKDFKEACSTVSQFNEEIDSLLKLYEMKREFQIYSIRVSFKAKESRSRVDYVQDLKLKYFLKFFSDLQEKQPFRFIHELKNKKAKISQKVLKKIVLWYLISHIEMFQIDNSQQHQINWMKQARKHLGNQTIRVIGLCWFCLPFLTCQMLKCIKFSQTRKL